MKKTTLTLIAALAAGITVVNAQPKGKPEPQDKDKRPGVHQPAQPPKPQPPLAQPKPAPKPEPPKVQPKPAPQPPPKHEPPKPDFGNHRDDHGPGHRNHPLEKPRERHYYKDWHHVERRHLYHYGVVPETLQVHLRPREEFEFQLEEDRKDGYKWFARYDSDLIKIDIDHEKGKKLLFFGRTPDYAEIEIEGKYSCDTIVELVYAKKDEWDFGAPPRKVIRLFVHID